MQWCIRLAFAAGRSGDASAPTVGTATLEMPGDAPERLFYAPHQSVDLQVVVRAIPGTHKVVSRLIHTDSRMFVMDLGRFYFEQAADLDRAVAELREIGWTVKAEWPQKS